MTKIDIYEATTGPDMDLACAEHFAELTGWHRSEMKAVIYYDDPNGDGDAIRAVKPGYGQRHNDFQPSTKMADAWMLHKAICNAYPEKQDAYFEALERVAHQEGYVIAWPEALKYLRPLDICRAFLIAVGRREIAVHDED